MLPEERAEKNGSTVFQQAVRLLMTKLGDELARGVAAGLDKSGLGEKLTKLLAMASNPMVVLKGKQPVTYTPAAETPEQPKATRKKRGAPPLTCSIDGCGLPNRSKGLCSKHYQAKHNADKLALGNTKATSARKQRWGSITANRKCSVSGCDSPARSKGLCAKHYQLERYSRLHPTSNRKPRAYTHPRYRKQEG